MLNQTLHEMARKKKKIREQNIFICLKHFAVKRMARSSLLQKNTIQCDKSARFHARTNTKGKCRYCYLNGISLLKMNEKPRKAKIANKEKNMVYPKER